MLKKMMASVLAVLMLAMLLPVTASAAGGPILLSGLKVKLRGMSYPARETVSGNNVIYTVDDTAGMTKMSGDRGAELLLSFKTKYAGGTALVPFTCYTKGALVADDGDWAVNIDGRHPNGYEMTNVDYTFDGTSNASYYLYKFKFFPGNLGNHNPGNYTAYTIRLKKNANDGAVVLSNVYYSFNGQKFPAKVTREGNTTVLTVDGTNKTKVKQFGEEKLYFNSNVGVMSRNVVNRYNETNYVSSTDTYTNAQSPAGVSFDKLKLSSAPDEANYYVYTGSVYDYFTFPLRASKEGEVSMPAPPLNYTGIRLRLRKYDQDITPTFANSLYAGEDTLMSPWNIKQLFRGNFVAVPGKDYREYVFEDVTFPFTIRIRSVTSYKNTFKVNGKVRSGTSDFTYTFTKDKPYVDLTYVPGSGVDTQFDHYVTGKWRLRAEEKGAKTSLSGAKVSSISSKTYTGKQIKPSVTVKVDGKKLKSGTDYTVKYGANKSVGKGTLTITGKGSYKGSKKVSFKIVPKKTAVSKLTAGKRQVKVTWKKVSAAQKISKYQLRFRVKGKTSWTTKTYGAATSTATLKSLKKGKRYEVQVRSYKVVSGAKYYSSWSTVKTSGKVR